MGEIQASLPPKPIQKRLNHSISLLGTPKITTSVLNITRRTGFSRQPPLGESSNGPNRPRTPLEPSRREWGATRGQGSLDECHLFVAHDLDRDFRGFSVAVAAAAAVVVVVVDDGLGLRRLSRWPSHFGRVRKRVRRSDRCDQRGELGRLQKYNKSR